MKYLFLILISILLNACASDLNQEELKTKTLNHYMSQKINGDLDRLNSIDSLIYIYNYETAEMFADRADIYNIKGDLKEVIYSYSKALELGYDKEVIYFNRAICYAENENDSLAWKDYSIYKHYFPEQRIGALLLQYNIQLKLEFTKDAISTLDTIISLKPLVPFYYYDKALLVLDLNDTIKYCDVISKSIELGILNHIEKTEDNLLEICNK